MGLMARIRRAVFGAKDGGNFSDVIRNVGQLEVVGAPAISFEPSTGPSPIEDLDPRDIPWELREDKAEE